MNGPPCCWCGSATDAEFVDVGVGWVQVTGGVCFKCYAYEMGPYQTDGIISEVEMATMWTGPIEDSAEYSHFNPDQREQP